LSPFARDRRIGYKIDYFEPLGLYNKFLVGYLLFHLYSYLSPLKLPFHATFCHHPFCPISSSLILQMTNNGNYNINNGDDNKTRNPPPTLEHGLAIQGQLFETMVLMQQTILQMQSTDERTKSRKRKNDPQGNASNMRAKQLKISRAPQVGYDKQKRPLSEMSPDYMDFFGFVPPSLIGGIQCATCGKKEHHFKVCLKRYTYCTHCKHYGHYSRDCPMKKLTPLELGNWLFKRQVKDDTLSQAMSHCSLNGSPTDIELRTVSQLVEEISGSSR
jgi:hypothetical protein